MSTVITTILNIRSFTNSVAVLLSGLGVVLLLMACGDTTEKSIQVHTAAAFTLDADSPPGGEAGPDHLRVTLLLSTPRNQAFSRGIQLDALIESQGASTGLEGSPTSYGSKKFSFTILNEGGAQLPSIPIERLFSAHGQTISRDRYYFEAVATAPATIACDDRGHLVFTGSDATNSGKSTDTLSLTLKWIGNPEEVALTPILLAAEGAEYGEAFMAGNTALEFNCP